MNENKQTELNLTFPEQESVTLEQDSGNLGADQPMTKGGEIVGEIIEPPDYKLAREIAQLVGSKSPEDQKRLAELLKQLENRRLRESGLDPTAGQEPSWEGNPAPKAKTPIVYWDPEIASDQRKERKERKK